MVRGANHQLWLEWEFKVVQVGIVLELALGYVCVKNVFETKFFNCPSLSLDIGQTLYIYFVKAYTSQTFSNFNQGF